ncbi:MAG: TonB-dependent receptor [Gammaproteobacteria bacterium]|nr:TonB-dependent receptor [Gammaproteobacteria bacterium]
MENSKLYSSGMAAAAVAATFFVAGPVQAQTAPGSSGNDSKSDTDTQALDTVIVTGTSRARTDLKTPLVATSISSDRLQSLAANGPADILSTVPALKAEGGGGEVAANIFVAGLPSAGQYQFTPLEFNGMPVIGSMGLNSSAPDVYYRTDLGIDRLEFVRGGVSNLFGGGGIGGVINFIDKTGSDTTTGVGQLEVSDHSRIRGDFAASGPIANNLYYAVSGFYRYDNGPLVTGFPTDGYQLRGNLKRQFDSGEVKIYFQAIDDKDQFYGDIPLTKGYQLARGNNGHLISTTETAALDNMSYLTPGGTFNTQVKDGAATRGGSVGIDFKKDLGDGWAFNGRGNLANYHHTFALFAGGDNITNLPTTQAAFLQSYGYNPSAYTGAFTYADSGKPVPANYLLWGDRVTDRDRPLTTATGELDITKELLTGDWAHHFTVGGFWGKTSARDYDLTYSYIGDFDNSPRLINVTVTNTATGAQTIVSRNGMVDAGLGYTNNYYDARRTAGYLADQMEVGNWVLDLGGRIETLTGNVRREQAATYTTDTTANLSPLLSQVSWGNGHFLSGTVNPTAWAVAGGALYKLDEHRSLFVNASRGFFMPNLNTVQIDSANDVQSFQAEIIKQAETGFKFSGNRISATIAAFYSTLSNRRNINFINGATPGSAPIEVTNLISTRSYGTEGTFNVRLTNFVSFESNATYEHDRYTQYTPVAACTNCVGNDMQRQPNVMANAGFYFRHSGFDASIFDTYTGRTFTSDLNNIKLPGYHIVRLDVGYARTFAGGDRARIGVSVYNLFDSDAVSEGSPRQGTLQNAGQAYFIGRQVLPRRVTARLTYDF